MFEKKDPFPWKIPVMILVGVAVLSGGIYIGVKTRNVNSEKDIVQTEQISTDDEQNVQETFNLSENYSIFLKKLNPDGSESQEPLEPLPYDDELLGKSKEEIRRYLSQEHPDKTVERISTYEIVLSEVETINDPSLKNKYALEVDGEFIGLYKYDNEGNRELIEPTDRRIESIPEVVQEQIKNGMVFDTEDEAYEELANLDS